MTETEMTEIATIEIETRWTFSTDDRDTDGYSVTDYFANDGFRRAEEADSKEEAAAILASTYKGADNCGIGLEWIVA